MSDLIPRRTLTELVARYELAPELYDIYVEGLFDKELLEQCCRAVGVKDKIVYEIDTIEIPDALLAKHQFTDGNKQRVLALARELVGKAKYPNYHCIVDKDFDHWLGKIEVTKNLRWTDFCSMELYFFDAIVLDEILLKVANCKIADWAGFLRSLADVLSAIYLIRLTNQSLGWCMSSLPFERNLTHTASGIAFDTSTYIQRLLISNKRGKQLDDFMAEHQRWKAMERLDVRDAIRGHDFIDLLSWVVGKFKGLKEFASSKAIERLLLLRAAYVQALLKTES